MARATGLSTAKVPTWTGWTTPPTAMKLVATEREALVRQEPQGELAVDGLAEVVVVLEPPGAAHADLLVEVPFQIEIEGHAVTRGVGRVVGRKPRKHLGPRDRPPPELVRRSAVDVGVGLAGKLLEVLPPVLGAEGHVQGRGQADVHLPREVRVHEELAEDQSARGGTRR